MKVQDEISSTTTITAESTGQEELGRSTNDRGLAHETLQFTRAQHASLKSQDERRVAVLSDVVGFRDWYFLEAQRTTIV